MACRVVAFANGGKCGSTTLAMLLKHKFPSYGAYDPASPFVDSAKELCGRGYACHDKRYLLDACPQAMGDERMRALRAYDGNATVVVFARPQHEALLSLYNDKGSSGTHLEDADAWVRRHLNMQLFNYTDVFLRASRTFRRVVLVETAELKTDEGAASVLRRVAEARGLPAFGRSRAILSNPSTEDARHTRAKLSWSTVDMVRAHWARTNAVLCETAPARFLCEAAPRVEL